jgi:hypothetical protein
MEEEKVEVVEEDFVEVVGDDDAVINEKEEEVK